MTENTPSSFSHPEIFERLKECLDDDSDSLTPWEVEFLDDCCRNGKSHTFSPKQIAVIERIWSKLFN